MPPYMDYTFSGWMMGGEYTYTLDMIITTFTLFKSYTLVRVYEHYSIWTCKEAKIIASLNGQKTNSKFAFKSDVKNENILVLAASFIIIVFFFAFIIRNLEK